MIKMQWLPEGRLQEPSISIMRFNREKIMLQSPSSTLYLCVCLLRQASRGQTKWPQTNAIHSAPQWSVRSKLCECVFLVTLKGAQSHVVPCRLGVCVYCAWHLVAKVNGLKQTRSTLRHNGRFGQSCVCVCFR